MFYAGSCGFQNAPLTVVAVLVLAAVDGSIRLHLQVEALLAEQSCHDAFQLWLWNVHTHTHVTRTHAHTHTPVGPSPVPTKNMSEQQSHNGEKKAQFSWYLCFQLTLRKKIIQKKCFTIIKCSAWLIKSWLWRMERISRTIIDLLYLKTFTVYFFCRI